MSVYKPQKIAVLGIHRSGTSMVTRLLNIAGLKLGSNLLRANKYNKRGHWEDREVVYLNELILKLLGGSWCKKPNLMRDDWWEHMPEVFISQAKEVKAELIKDPRLCLTIPFWKKFFDFKFIVVKRNKESVIKSINQKKSMFSVEQCQGIYDFYHENLQANIKGEIYSELEYEDFFTNKESPTLIQLALRDIGIRALLSSEQREEMKKFVKLSLKHH